MSYLNVSVTELYHQEKQKYQGYGNRIGIASYTGDAARVVSFPKRSCVDILV